MRFGICCAPGAQGDPARLLDSLADAGADYVEWTVGAIMASMKEFEKLRALSDRSPIKPEAFCVFLPPHHRITGPKVNLAATLEYAGEAARRCASLGAEIIVLGSGSARRVPEGFSPKTARAQFVEFCRELAPLVDEAGITIAIEPLNSKEDNLITSIEAGARFVDEIAQPSIALLADYYHMNHDGEPLQNVVDAGNRLRHAHLADTNRVAPGYAAQEADLRGFFGALRSAGYDDRVSFEGKSDDLGAQAPKILARMKERYAQAQA